MYLAWAGELAWIGYLEITKFDIASRRFARKGDLTWPEYLEASRF
jgi:hypothetical protein